MRIKSFFKKLFSNRKRSLELFLPIALIILSFTAYLVLSQRKEPRVFYEADFRDQTIINALNNYRVENLDRAELLFERVLSETKSKKKKSLAELYLGSIYFKRELYEKAIEHYERAITYNKRNIHALHNMALSYIKTGDAKKALSYAQKAYAMEKNLDENLLLLGNIYFSLGRFEEALSVYSMGNVPADVFRYNCARVHAQLGDFKTSTKMFQSIVDNQENSAVVRGLSLIGLGLLRDKEDVARVTSMFEQALEIFPSSELLQYNLAIMFLKGGLYEMAVTSLKSLLEETERKSELLGFALYKSGRFREALNHYNRMESAEQKAEYFYIIGDLYVKLGLLDQSIPYYEKAMENTQYKGAFNNLFRIYFKEGLYENAKRLCYEFIEADEANPLPHTLLADVLFLEGRESEARSHLEKAVDLSRNEISSLTGIAEVWEKYGHFNNALFIYQTILALEPDHYEAAVRIAEIQLLTGHKQKAKATFERAREMISDISEYYRVSILIAGCEETQNALSIYKIMINDFPYRYEAYYNLSILYLETGDYDGAIQAINQCMETVPNLDPPTLSNLYSILGLAQIKRGRVIDAAKLFQEARRLDNTNEIPVINLRRMGYLSR